MSEAFVSALIPVHNGERHLGESIESILAQTHAVGEILVVDNASSDATAEVARSFGERVRLVHEPRQGISFARNAAIAAAAGDFLAFLDHDDLWEPRKTELQLAALEAEPELDFVTGHVVQFTEGIEPERVSRLQIPEGPQPGQHLDAVMAPLATWERVGPWEGDHEVGDGLVWFIRANHLGLRSLMLPEVIARRRIHGDNHSFGNHEHRGEWMRALKASLDARRGSVSPARPGDDRSGA